MPSRQRELRAQGSQSFKDVCLATCLKFASAVNGSRLNSTPAAAIANFCGEDMIFSVWHQEREGREVSDDLFFGFRTRNP